MEKKGEESRKGGEITEKEKLSKIEHLKTVWSDLSSVRSVVVSEKGDGASGGTKEPESLSRKQEEKEVREARNTCKSVVSSKSSRSRSSSSCSTCSSSSSSSVKSVKSVKSKVSKKTNSTVISKAVSQHVREESVEHIVASDNAYNEVDVFLQALQDTQEQLILLNVGGVHFETRKVTLRADPSRVFSLVLIPNSSFRPSGNVYFFDRDPSHFRIIFGISQEQLTVLLKRKCYPVSPSTYMNCWWKQNFTNCLA